MEELKAPTDRILPLLVLTCAAVSILIVTELQAGLGSEQRGRSVFVEHCAACHGGDAKGRGELADELLVTPANLTDCRLTAEDPVEVLQGIIRYGGSYLGLSDEMPAWYDTLTDENIADVAQYVKSLCADPDWVPGELNFPRPLITGKAFPEQEGIVGTRLGQGDQDLTEVSGTMEYRLDGLTNVEIKTRFLSRNGATGPTVSSLGDTSLGVRRVVAFSAARRAIASIGLELGVPTGSESQGLGTDELVWEPNVRGGWEWKNFVTQGAMTMIVPHETADINTQVRYDLAFGRSFHPDPRLTVTPMFEVNSETHLMGSAGGDTKSAVLPELRVMEWGAGHSGASDRFARF